MCRIKVRAQTPVCRPKTATTDNNMTVVPLLPTHPTLHPATFTYFQNWKWSLRGEEIWRQRKFMQSRRQSWTRYKKMTYKNTSKIGSAAEITVKPQKEATLKVMPAPNV